MLTEGTYPYVVGGVSSWCQALILAIPEIDWHVVPVTAGGMERRSLFDIPSNARVHDGIDLWGPPMERRRRVSAEARPLVDHLAPRLADLLLSSNSDLDQLADLLTWCEYDPALVRTAFRSNFGWSSFLNVLGRVSQRTDDGLFAPVHLTAMDAASIWQNLYWLASTATVELPPVDLVVSSAAGWNTAMVAAAKVNRGLPVVLVEHGLYVREAYLESVRSHSSPGRQFASTRIAVGLSRLAYRLADRVSPVCDGHQNWEGWLGADLDKIQPIPNGVDVDHDPPDPIDAPVVVAVGRIDPLKDIATYLRAARYVCDVNPTAQFLHYGPVSDHNRAYADMCYRIHDELGLGDRFRFMGGTSDPSGVMRDSMVCVSSSISEGLPLSVMESMAQARPVVGTDVGGCADLLAGCGILVPAGDSFALGAGIQTILEDPELARQLGSRGYERVKRRFSTQKQVSAYRQMIQEMAGRSGVGLPV